MKPKYKVITVLGTRPELIRVSALVKALDQHPHIHHRFVHTGQNNHPQLSEVFFKDLNLRKPDFQLSGRQPTRDATITKMKTDIKQILIHERPQAFLVLGDTDSALTSEIAKRLGIPVFHMEAGNRCFDRRSPEEKNRKIIDHLADVNFPYAQESKQHLINEGIRRPIVITGSPLREVFLPLLPTIKDRHFLSRYELRAKQYMIWSTHRAEHVDSIKVLEKGMHCLIKIAKAYPMFKILVTTHPRLQLNLNNLKLTFPNNIEFHEPFGLLTYLSLQYHSFAVLSDSGSIHEEADIIGFHAVHLRRRHERPEAEAIPVTFLSEFKTKAILMYLKQIAVLKPKRNQVKAYRTRHFSQRVIQTLLSFLKK